jgi:ABC-type dipeptide/oligopeptide/nickel transport system ATPase component
MGFLMAWGSKPDIPSNPGNWMGQSVRLWMRRKVRNDETKSAAIGAQVLLLLQELQREFALTFVFISHSLPVVAQVATRIAVMRAGQFLETGPAEQVLHQPQHPYTRELLSAVPELPSA